MQYNRTDIKVLAYRIHKENMLLSSDVQAELEEILQRLKDRCSETVTQKYYKYKALRSHVLPITNVAFDKYGERYDCFFHYSPATKSILFLIILLIVIIISKFCNTKKLTCPLIDTKFFSRNKSLDGYYIIV